jgi:aryl-alcohol dehydrogenase-like predicted oxidoreductase
VITTLGDTGLSVTRIGLGLAALGRPAYINLGHAFDVAGDTEVAALERHAHGVLDAATGTRATGAWMQRCTR